MSDMTVTLRYAFPDDHDAVLRLATLDSASLPAAPILLAEVEGELRAGVSLCDGSEIADPFHPTAALLDLLRARAAQLAAPIGARRHLRLRARTAPPPGRRSTALGR